MRINWSSIIVMGISGIAITMPDIAHVSIFMDNDLTHITDDHFEIKLIARLLNQIYVVHQQDRLLLSQLCLTFPSSMDGVRSQNRSKLPCPSELDNRTPPATSDRA